MHDKHLAILSTLLTLMPSARCSTASQYERRSRWHGRSHRARHEALPRTAQALTGYLHMLTILPLSQGEIGGQTENLFEQMLIDPGGTVRAQPSSTTSCDEYVERVSAGGFPLALRRTGAAHDRRFDDYRAVEGVLAKLANRGPLD